jgi:hypothetical protein
MSIRSILITAACTLSAATAFAATPVLSTTDSVYFDDGVNVLGVVNDSVYTIDMTFSLGRTDTYRKLLDFSGLTSDAGLYAYEGAVGLYSSAPYAQTGAELLAGSSTTFGIAQVVRLTITRDTSDLFSVYLNGVSLFSFTDSNKTTVFSLLNGKTNAWLFADDTTTESYQQSWGTLKSLTVYNTALSATQVASVPEPEALAMMAAGLLTVGALARRRKQA